MVSHMSRVTTGKTWTRIGTLCGRSNRQSRDGMNCTPERAHVTCKHCLRILSRQDARIVRVQGGQPL